MNAAGSFGCTDADLLLLRRTIERYRRLLRMVSDPRALASLKQLLTETEEHLAALERDRTLSLAARPVPDG